LRPTYAKSNRTPSQQTSQEWWFTHLQSQLHGRHRKEDFCPRLTPGKKTLSEKRAGGVLKPTKPKALSSNPSTAKKEKYSKLYKYNFKLYFLYPMRKSKKKRKKKKKKI
jgi:hypothetical protein